MSRTAISLGLVLLVVLGLVLVAAPSADPQADPENADVKAVRRACLDYLEGCYEVKPELIARSVHPRLAKLGFWKEDGGEYQLAEMTQEGLQGFASRWNAGGDKVDEDSPRDLEVIEVLDQTAIARLRAEWGVDFFHLARFDGQWKIIHVLWQTHPPEPAGNPPEPTDKGIR